VILATCIDKTQVGDTSGIAIATANSVSKSVAGMS
jgi:hypothetical protein